MKKRIVIIGGGPGGYVAAIRAAQLGAEVHLIEKERLGGTCLNVGCIPTKALLHTAGLFNAIKEESARGLLIANGRIDWPMLQAHKAKTVQQLVQGVGGLLKANGVKVHEGRAVLRDAATVRVEGPEPMDIKADGVILAVGSAPQHIPVPGINLPGVINSTAALNLQQIPKTMVIIGGGVIGTELAALYSMLGTSVAVVEMLPQILPPVDGQIAAKVRGHLAERGVVFFTETRLGEITQTAAGLRATVYKGAEKHELPAEYVLVATGRVPNTKDLELDAVGIATDKGRILVNADFATNVPGIYAIGDCNGQMMLAHAASAQGVAAVEHALGHPAVYNRKVIPSCIYTNPEVAGVGLTEEQARAQGIAYKSGIFPLKANGKSLIEGCTSGIIKIIADPVYGEILGAHIFGPRATDMIGEAALAMHLEATVDDLINTIHAHPTVSEAMAEAAMNVSGAAIHWPPGVKPV